MLTDMANGLADDFDITVVTSRALYNDPLARLERRDHQAGVEILRLNTTRMGRDSLLGRLLDYVSFYIRVFLFILRYVGKGDLVVLKTDPPLLSLMNTGAVRLKGGRVINWLQDVFPEVAIELGAFPRCRIFSGPLIGWRNRTLRTASCNIVISKRMRDLFASQNVNNINVIPNWADGDLIRPLAHTNNPLRAEWNPDSKFLVGYSGNFGRAHAFEEVLEAMTLLKVRPEIHFVLIGEGAGLEQMLETVERRGLSNVSFHPYQPHDTLRQSLGAIDLHLVTLRENMEGLVLPSKIYGVLAAGRPLAFVGEEDGEIASLILENGIGCAIAHGHGAKLAEQIQQLASDPQRLVQMGLQSRKLFDEEYSMKKSIERWKKLIKGIAS